MIKLCIVDDEKEIREGIANNVDWEAYDIQLCGLAEDFHEAMLIYDKYAPDIIILDINMPGESGLELAKQIHQANSSTKILILSGYDNFSYAQQALRYHVTDYLLKPCRSSDILKAVLKAKELLEHERLAEQDIRKIKSQYTNTLPLLKKQFLLDLMLGPTANPEKILQKFALYRIGIMPYDLRTVVIMSDDSKAADNYQEQELMKSAIQNILKEIIENVDYEMFEYDNHTVLLYNIQNDDQMLKQLQLFFDKASQCLWFKLSIGIGSRCDNAETIFNSYLEAYHAAKTNLFFNISTITCCNEIKLNGQDSFFYPMEDEVRIIESIGSNNLEAALLALDDFIRHIQESNCTTEAVKNACFILTVKLTDLSKQKVAIPSSNLFHLTDVKSLSLLHKNLQKMVEHLINTSSGFVSHNQIISNTICYIDEHYKDDISLEFVAREVYVTPKYLSTLFKRTVGQNFTDYLHSVRIQKACELLQNTRMMVYDIAAAVGYKSPKHFSKIFNKHIGKTPNQFRNDKF